MSPDDLEALEETLALLSDPELTAQVRAARAEIAAGDFSTLDAVLHGMATHGREHAVAVLDLVHRGSAYRPR